MASHLPTFPNTEYQTRLRRVIEKMEERELDACLLSMPENICYLTGLNHWGFFATHILIIKNDGSMSIVARAMERVTLETQLDSTIKLVGHSDAESITAKTVEALKELGLAKAHIGLDLDTLYRSYEATRNIMDYLPDAKWENFHTIIEELRFIKSPHEIAAMRQAATITERMMEASIRVAAAGVNEKVVAAEVCKEMILAGGEPPSFGPFIRPKSRLGEEHGTWGNESLRADDTLFVELSGSYQRYHAPMGRFVYLKPPKGNAAVKKVCLDAFGAVIANMKPGVTADAVYQSWQNVVDSAGLPEYKRHHCGYMVGMSFPPTWMEGANRAPIGLRKGSKLILEAGMTFHVLSWLVGSRLGDYFVSNTVLVTEKGGEVLTTSHGESN